MKKLILVAVLSLSLMLAGCQAAEEKPTNTNQNTENNNGEDERLGVPFSNGPTNPPDVKGPSNPPPAEETPQAVTQKEDIRLTLPIKTE